MLGSTRLHLGANFQHRENSREALGANYQTRPMTQLTDQRFISTGNIAGKSDNIAGVEVGAIMKSFHFAGEAQKVWVNAYTPAEIAALNAETGHQRYAARHWLQRQSELLVGLW